VAVRKSAGPSSSPLPFFGSMENEYLLLPPLVTPPSILYSYSVLFLPEGKNKNFAPLLISPPHWDIEENRCLFSPTFPSLFFLFFSPPWSDSKIPLLLLPLGKGNGKNSFCIASIVDLLPSCRRNRDPPLPPFFFLLSFFPPSGSACANENLA